MARSENHCETTRDRATDGRLFSGDLSRLGVNYVLTACSAGGLRTLLAADSHPHFVACPNQHLYR